MNCTICGTELTGKQTKFCSKSCKFKDQNTKNQNYAKQQERGKLRKLAAIERFGGCCKNCGYSRNWAALAFHHKEGKDFGLDLRSFSNNSLEKINLELEKCELLCHNCHSEFHNPQCFFGGGTGI